MDTDFIARAAITKFSKSLIVTTATTAPEDLHNSNGTDEPVEIGLYLDGLPTTQRPLEKPLEGAPCLSILETGQ